MSDKESGDRTWHVAATKMVSQQGDARMSDSHWKGVVAI